MIFLVGLTFLKTEEGGLCHMMNEVNYQCELKEASQQKQPMSASDCFKADLSKCEPTPKHRSHTYIVLVKWPFNLQHVVCCVCIYLRWSTVDWCSVIVLVKLCVDVHVTACLSLPADGVSFAVRVTTYLSWISLLFACNTTGFLSLPHFLTHVSLKILFLLLYFSILLCLLQLLCFAFEMYFHTWLTSEFPFTVSVP